MPKLTRISSATALMLILFWSTPILAASPQSHGNPHVTAPAHVSAPTPHGAPATTTHGAAPATHGPSTTHGNPHTTKTTTVSTTPSASTASSGSTTSNTTTASGSTTPTASNPVALKIAAHPQLAAKVAALLPSGTTLATASSGFRNQGQFIAALHVSKNLNLPFTTLKATMLGTPLPTAGAAGTSTTGTTSATTAGTTTAPAPMSLGQAIHKLRASVDATAAASTATGQATNDVNSTTTK
jgi:hypothetical protein